MIVMLLSSPFEGNEKLSLNSLGCTGHDLFSHKLISELVSLVA